MHARQAALTILSALAVGACGARSTDAPPSPPRTYLRPADLDPNKAPHAWSTFNVDAIRAGKSTVRLLALVATILPDGVSIDDVSWVHFDGPGELADDWRNVRFVALHSGEMVATKGKTEPAPPDAKPPSAAPSSRILSVRVRAPSKKLHIPFFDPPASVEDLVLTVDARDDGGAAIALVERSSQPAEIADARASLERMVTRLKGTKTNASLLDVFANAKVTSDGEGATLTATATAEQVEAAVDLAVTLLRGP